MTTLYDRVLELAHTAPGLSDADRETLALAAEQIAQTRGFVERVAQLELAQEELLELRGALRLIRVAMWEEPVRDRQERIRAAVAWLGG